MSTPSSGPGEDRGHLLVAFWTSVATVLAFAVVLVVLLGWFGLFAAVLMVGMAFVAFVAGSLLWGGESG